jgi:hypothetical protein
VHYEEAKRHFPREFKELGDPSSPNGKGLPFDERSESHNFGNETFPSNVNLLHPNMGADQLPELLLHD